MYAVYEQTSKFECVVWGAGKTAQMATSEAIKCLKHFCAAGLRRDPTEKKHHRNSAKARRLFEPLKVSACTKSFAEYVDKYGGASVFFLRVSGRLTLEVKQMTRVIDKLATDIKNAGKLGADANHLFDDLIAVAEEIKSHITPEDNWLRISHKRSENDN